MEFKNVLKICSLQDLRVQTLFRIVRSERYYGTRSRANGKHKISWCLELEVFVTTFKRSIIAVSGHEEFFDWSNQSNENPTTCDNDPLASKNSNIMASTEPSNVERIPDKKDNMSCTKRPNPRDDMQGAEVYAP